MASLYISEYAELPKQDGQMILIGKEPCIASQKLTVGAETKSTAFQLGTRFVRLHTDAICSIKFGADPTAATTDARLAAGATEFFGVTKGHKLSVISNT
jgi:hypothetical protein